MANTQTFMVHTDFYGEQIDLKMHRFFMVQHRLFMANLFDDCIATEICNKH